MKRYGLWGPTRRDFLTYQGRVLVHGNRHELEWLFPGAPVREVPPSISADQTWPVEHHPDLVSVTWPLDPRDFR